MNLFAGFDQGSDLVQREHTGGVAQGIGRVGMNFHEQGVGAGCRRGLGQNGGHVGLAGAGGAQSAGTLGAVGGVENDGATQLLHGSDSGHVVDQPIVAEEGAAFGKEDLFVAGGADFLNAVFHFVGTDELSLFDIDRFSGIAAGDQQVGLAAQKRGDLQAVHHFTDGFGL